MDQNFGNLNQNNSQSNFGQQNSNVPPPPPTPEDQVAIRSMESDAQSVKQSGGEMPQSQIVSAPELSSLRSDESAPLSNRAEQPIKAPQDFSYQSPVSNPAEAPSSDSSETAPVVEDVVKSGGFSMKRILIIVLIVVVAAGLGYGVFYLISSLNKTQEIVPADNLLNQNLPSPNPPEVNPPIVNDGPVVPETPKQILSHTPFISGLKSSEKLVLSQGQDLASFKALITDVSKTKLISGDTKELAFTFPLDVPVSSKTFLDVFLPSASLGLGSSVEDDITTWLYGDKVGGNKFGLALKLKNISSIAQATTSVGPIIESSFADIPNLFISKVSLPSKIEFKDGQVSGKAVRFLVFDSKTGNVFEYGFIQKGENYYLVMTTSYNQMVDIIKKINDSPLISPVKLNETSTTTATGTKSN